MVDVELLLITSINAAQTGTNLINVGTTLFRNFFIIKHPFLSLRLPIILQSHYNIKCQQCQYNFQMLICELFIEITVLNIPLALSYDQLIFPSYLLNELFILLIPIP